jgi:hypothetical protein
MKTISLTQGKVTLVDDADYAKLAKHKWCAMRVRRLWYAVRVITLSGHGSDRKRRTLLMHREIMGATGTIEVDHENSDGLDNQRHNLRLATSLQNSQNTRDVVSSSRFKGVSWHKASERWRASIRANGRQISLGYFFDEAVAGEAYKRAALKYFGAFARY